MWLTCSFIKSFISRNTLEHIDILGPGDSNINIYVTRLIQSDLAVLSGTPALNVVRHSGEVLCVFMSYMLLSGEEFS